ncbi:LysM peptidoglycan-binding domain-containing protein [Myroides sp. N17-2]|uniref:LysM peptidoglycan-binding domain-containing protein n=1 Tax=Myroides sp. N17-2 TaxID=2030799 RepID=UPI000EFD533B|nr:LysM peptidoglycan-binding domain-containing protein [Myroides sp. N17-2]
MKRNKIAVFVVGVLFHISSFGQSQGNSTYEYDVYNGDQDNKEIIGNKIYYTEQLNTFFSKLQKVTRTKKGKINIVHIGDSHIQADFFSGRMRVLLQNKFGNGGLGFAFPYKLAKTNGNALVRYSSNAEWNSYRNIYPVKEYNVGLSGIALTTIDKNAVIELSVRDANYGFSRMKVFTPSNTKDFNVGTASQSVFLESSAPKKVSHQIKKGESLTGIANKYGASVESIKKANNMKTNTIHAGKKLAIPTQQKESVSVANNMFNELSGEKNDVFYTFEIGQELDRIYFYSNKQAEAYDLNGVVLENDKPGILYHTIGVNGAKFSDYTKYDLFFKQLRGLEPDLVIVSMGTNESFDRMDAKTFQSQVNAFLEKVKKVAPNANVLVTTPPPSYFSKDNPNHIAGELANELIINGISGKYAIWDLYYNLGGTLGLSSLRENGMLSKDLVHYTVKGYEYTGDLFYEALLEAYNQFVKQQ